MRCAFAVWIKSYPSALLGAQLGGQKSEQCVLVYLYRLPKEGTRILGSTAAAVGGTCAGIRSSRVRCS